MVPPIATQFRTAFSPGAISFQAPKGCRAHFAFTGDGSLESLPYARPHDLGLMAEG